MILIGLQIIIDIRTIKRIKTVYAMVLNKENRICADNEIDIRRILIIPVPDIYVHSLWTHQVDILVPSYEVVFTNDIFTALLFKERGIKIVQPMLYQRKELSATEIRSRIANDGDWKNLVTQQTVKVIENIHGIDRIKAIFANYI